jgi:hypothetical protein
MSIAEHFPLESLFEEVSVSKKEAVIIACRALAVYLLFWFLQDLTLLPSNLFSLWHHRDMLGATEWTTYLRNSELISLTFRLLRMVALFFAVQWFYRAGPALQRYFLDSTDKESASE